MTNFLTKKHDIPFPPSLSHCAGLRFSVVQKLIQDSDLQRVSRGLNHVCVSQSGLKAHQFHSPGQAKRRPGFGMRTMGAPCKGKSLRLLYTFALTGRSYIALTTQGAASLALGYGIDGLSARGSRRHCSARRTTRPT